MAGRGKSRSGRHRQGLMCYSCKRQGRETIGVLKYDNSVGDLRTVSGGVLGEGNRVESSVPSTGTPNRDSLRSVALQQCSSNGT